MNSFISLLFGVFPVLSLFRTTAFQSAPATTFSPSAASRWVRSSFEQVMPEEIIPLDSQPRPRWCIDVNAGHITHLDTGRSAAGEQQGV